MDRDRAERAVNGLLSGMPDRLAHVLGVGAKSEELARQLPEIDGSTLVPAALLHDIGYAPSLFDTGFHQVDGARWLAAQGEHRLAGLVAHHSCAWFEAAERGLLDALDIFPHERSLESDALSYCDLTTGPDGTPMTFEERIEDILSRYGPGHPVARSLMPALPQLSAAIARVTSRLSLVDVN